MGYRNIVLAGSSKLSIKNSNLVISGETEHKIPIEDIQSILIENQDVTMSTYVLSALSLNGVCVYLCDSKHLPCSVLLPFAQYSRQRKMLYLQLSQSKPSQKRLWQQIVKAKITNQANCLEILGKDGSKIEELRNICEQVRSGDTENAEARAASVYFKTLFGSSFTRGDENDINAALNYGYAIIRAYIARQLADYGFEVCLGIHHCSELNNFNLADDIIEPFRALVDLFVYANVFEKDAVFDTKIKYELVNLINYELISGNEKHSCAYSIERMIHSLRQCYEDKERDKEDALCIPLIYGLHKHEYE